MKINKRHIAKSLSWRFVGSIDTFLFAWVITGDLKEGINLSLITTFTKLIWYYFHEQIWVKSAIVNSNKRHLIKTFSWRVIGTLDTILLGWLITGNPFTGLKIGGVETVSKMLLYFGHEKLWYKINYGLDVRNKKRRIMKFKA
jgi:uncharacterized membrane protein